MKRPIWTALWIALPVEIISRFFMPPLDVDFPTDATPWYAKAMAGEWVILHFPGLWLTSRTNMFDSNLFLPILFVCGYLTTAMLLFLLISLIRALLPFGAKGITA